MYGKTIKDYLNGYKKKPLITGTLDLYKLGITYDEWKESEHPRDDEGKFSNGGKSGSSNGSKEDKEITQKEKTKENIKNAIENIINNKTDEIVVKNVRNDLEKYGGTNDITFIKGNNKGGIIHFSKKHKDDINGIIETLISGKITNYVKNRKVYIESNDYLALLSLDYFGNKKTWLLTGYKKENK